MHRIERWLVVGGTALIVILGLTAVGTAQERWHWPDHPENLQVLPKDTNSEQLRKTMGMFVRGLGVRCAFCHVGEEGKPLSTYDFPPTRSPTRSAPARCCDGEVDQRSSGEHRASETRRSHA